MNLEIVPFRETHLEAAAALLALRHQAHRAQEPALPERFTQPAGARTALETVWRQPDVGGVVALAAGRMLGYLIGSPRIDLVWGRSVWVYLPGHAVDPGYGAELYRDLYGALSPEWVARGCYAHYAIIPASDRDALEAWFALSFGKEQAHGIRETATAADGAWRDPSLEIRRATLADLDASMALDDVIPRQHARGPVYAPYVPGEYIPFGPRDLEAIREETMAILQNEHARLWLAFREGALVGYQFFMPVAPAPGNDDSMLVPAQCSALAGAATRETEQGRGVGRALTAHGLAAEHAAGLTHCITDWRVTNLLSSRFWPRRGFRPVAYRLSRRLDGRIAWAHAAASSAPWRSDTGVRVSARRDHTEV